MPPGAGASYDFFMLSFHPRRTAPRIPSAGLCGIVTANDLRPASMVDVSADGLRIELPFDARTAQRTVQLELELPGVDEVAWARGHVTFAHLSPMGGTHPDGQPRLWCRAGLVLELAVGRDHRRLREYVMETYRARARASAIELVAAAA